MRRLYRTPTLTNWCTKLRLLWLSYLGNNSTDTQCHKNSIVPRKDSKILTKKYYDIGIHDCIGL